MTTIQCLVSWLMSGTWTSLSRRCGSDSEPQRQSQPEIVAAFLILYMVLGRPFQYRVLIVAQFASGDACSVAPGEGVHAAFLEHAIEQCPRSRCQRQHRAWGFCREGGDSVGMLGSRWVHLTTISSSFVNLADADGFIGLAVSGFVVSQSGDCTFVTVRRMLRRWPSSSRTPLGTSLQR